MVVDTPRPDTSPPSPLTPAGAGPGPALARLARRVPVNRWTVAALVLALTLASLALRVGQLRVHYWIDEAISVGIASHTLAALQRPPRQDGSPPLYYLLLHGWMRVRPPARRRPTPVAAVRADAVPVAYWAGPVFDRRAGVTAAVLAAGLPFLTTYAQETRMYSLIALLSLLVRWGSCMASSRAGAHLALLVGSLAAAIYTHNWALFLGVATFIAFLSNTY